MFPTGSGHWTLGLDAVPQGGVTSGHDATSLAPVSYANFSKLVLAPPSHSKEARITVDKEFIIF